MKTIKFRHDVTAVIVSLVGLLAAGRSAAQCTPGVDQDGIMVLYKPKTDGSKWFFTNSSNPNNDGEFRIDGDGSATKQTDPVAGSYWTVRSREGGLQSGGTQQTLRLHVTIAASNKSQTNYSSGYHQRLAQQGYMISPEDFRNFEMTSIVRCRNIVKTKGRITHKVRGGSHTGDNDPRAACVGSMVSFDEARTSLAEKELYHPNYDFYTVKKLLSNINENTLENKWIGTKYIVYNLADGTVQHIMYVNMEPFHADGTVNNNNWKKYYEWVDNQSQVVTWGGKIITWRINESKNFDMKYMSVREIDPAAVINSGGGNIALTPSSTSDNGSGNGSATVSATGGTSPYTYLWSNGGTTQTISGLAAGNYSVTVTDAKGCSSTTTVTVNIICPTIQITDTKKDVSCNGLSDGGITVNVTGGALPYTYTWGSMLCGKVPVSSVTAIGDDGNAPANVLDGNLSTRWSYNGLGAWITADLGAAKSICGTDIAWYSGDQRTNNLVLAVSSDGNSYTDVFSGKSSGTTTALESYAFQPATGRYLRVTVNGNSSNNWASITELVVNGSDGITTKDRSNLSAGTYSLTVVDASGCQATHTVTINEPPAITLTASSTTDNGSGNGSATVTASGGTSPYSYLWSNGGVTQTISNLAAGTYSVTVTDAGGCTKTASVEVKSTTSTPCTPSGGGPDTDIFGVKMMFPTNGNGAKPWNMGYDDYTSRFTKSASVSGSGSNATLTLDSKSRVGVKAVGSSSCEGLIDHKKAAAQGYMCSSKDWRNYEMTSYFYTSDMGGDDYTMYGRGGRHTGSGYPDGCLGSAYKASIDINGRTRWGKEQWHVSYDYGGGGGWKSSGISVKGKWIGYKIVVYNTGSATNPDVVVELWLDNGNNSTTPSNQWKLVNKVTDKGGWGSDGGECGGAKDQKITWGGPHVTFRTDAGSVKIKWVSVREIDPNGSFGGAPLTVSGTATDATCGNSDGTAAADATGGVPPYSYAWSNGGNTKTVTGLSAGTYFVTVTDNGGCTATAGVTVSQASCPPNCQGLQITNTKTDVSCNGQSDGSITVSVTGGTSPYQYTWGSMLCGKLPVASVTAIGDDGNVPSNVLDGNLSTRWSNNGAGSWITADLGSVKSICGVDIAWYSGDQRTNNFVLSVSSDGNTFTTVQTGKSSGTTSAPESYAFTPASGRYFRVTVNGNSSNNWASITELAVNGSVGITTRDRSNLGAGSYTLTVVDANGCTGSHTVTINEPAAVTANTSTSPDNGSGNGSATVTAGGGTPSYTYLWNNGATTATISNASGGSYSVTVTDANGCNASATATIGSGCNSLNPVAVSAIGDDGNVPANAFDGDLNTRWSNNGVGSWITADLGAIKTLCSVDIAWYRGNERMNDFSIALSSDGVAFTTVLAGQSSGQTLAHENYAFTPATARYVKVTVNGNSLNNWASITEIRLNGSGAIRYHDGENEAGGAEAGSGLEMLVYPNPAGEEVKVAVSSTESGVHTLRLINLVGQVIVVQQEFLDKQVTKVIPVYLSQIERGIYFISITGGERTVSAVLKKQ